jgi:OOP family OmpA-OmpF porin
MTLLVAAILAVAAAAQPARDPTAIAPPAGARLIQSSTIDGPLELKQATQDDEAVLAGLSHSQRSYERPAGLTPLQFIALYRDSLFAAGWRLIQVSKVAEAVPQEETLTVAAHYRKDGRNIYARVDYEPDGPLQIAIADVGAENWREALARECRIPVPGLQFDLDRPTLREYESEPTLQKLADLLKARNAPAVEIQGHMDNVGEAGVASRQTLSEGRAKVVAAWLIAHGVPASKITAKGYGKTKPIAENDSDLGRALNRRIEIARRDCPK